jgi:hypothetical protein
MVLLAGASLVLPYLHWKAQKPRQGDHLKKAKPLDGLLRDHPSQRKAVEPPIRGQRLELCFRLSLIWLALLMATGLLLK